MNKTNNRLILGTVQFGMDYGISNKLGKPSQETVNTILENSKNVGIKTLDTSDFYGDSADRIGLYFLKYGHNFEVISKFCLVDNRPLDQIVKDSLSRLGLNYLSGYLFHRFDDFVNFDRFDELEELREKGLVLKVGVSVYGNKQIEIAMNNTYVDIIQLPFNIFDSSEEKIALLKRAKELGKEIHARSVYLQGLLFMEPENLSGKLEKLAGPLEELQTVQKRSGFSMTELSLAYVESFNCIDRILVGVDSPEQIITNFSRTRKRLNIELLNELRSIRISDLDLLNPSLWQ